MSHKAWQNAHAMYENDACAKALGIDIISMDEGFAAKFTEKISVPIFTNDELVLFAKSYSAELR